jgi:hypothetical protein
MPNLPLHIRKHLTGIGLVPAPVQLLGGNAKLDNKIAGEIFRLDFASFLAPEPSLSPMMIRASEPPIK